MESSIRVTASHCWLPLNNGTDTTDAIRGDCSNYNHYGKCVVILIEQDHACPWL